MQQQQLPSNINHILKTLIQTLVKMEGIWWKNRKQGNLKLYIYIYTI